MSDSRPNGREWKITEYKTGADTKQIDFDIRSTTCTEYKQELSYRKQIARKLRTQDVGYLQA